MDRSRRAFLIATGFVLARPGPLRAQSGGDGDHRLQLDLPVLSEDASAVPVQVFVDHPMESDHFIRSIEITVDTDPVPYKGTFLFTPANGRAWVGFQMRSGVGGLLRAVGECSRHGRFSATREYRVAEGGCTPGPDPAVRERLGNPRISLPRSVKAGDIVEVKTKVDHASDTGLVLKSGRFVRSGPPFHVRQMLVYLDDAKISEFQMSAAISPDPLIRFPLKLSRSAMLRIVFVNTEAQRWQVSQAVRL